MSTQLNKADYTVVCKELGQGKTAVYEIKTEVTTTLLNNLSLRSRFNPELRYFLTKKENLELVMRHLKLNTKNSIPALIKDYVVEINF